MIACVYFRILSRKYQKIAVKSTCYRCASQKSTAELKTKTYSHTILTPKTNFPTRSNNAKKEEIQKSAQFAELYNWQREHLTGPEFVLHDGPPYANGDMHMGHAVNKIIKDINNRSQILQGNKVHYIPGWDCHGLPIELKALQKAKKSSTKEELSDAVHIRKIARTFALETVERQKESFKSWGVMADWDKQYYLTLNNKYVQNQLRKFYDLYKMGLIFRALKPVYWSPSSRTALAEAELEYDPNYKSKEVYVRFPFEKIPNSIQHLVKGKLYAIIWTTTPWTLPANRAICYNNNLKYSLVTLENKPGDTYVVASETIDSLQKVLGEIVKVAEFDGSTLEGATYANPLYPGGHSPLCGAGHVTSSAGSGLVHTAPAHGPHDYVAALEHGLDLSCNVDESGRYVDVHPDLNGLNVLTDGQDRVIDMYEQDILHQGVYIHSYPLDWRTKKPVIWRASEQWFIDTGALKEKALEALSSVDLQPPSSSAQYRQGFKGLLEKRPYWCISRQRAWGVPIPVLYWKKEPLVDTRIIDRFCELLDTKGPDVWWTSDAADLLPRDVIQERGIEVGDVTKGKDIMDIWLDSGLSWHVCGNEADLYSEGVDQLTGWFQASLLTALPLTGRAPYKSLFVHGFVVDDKKRKMSKSIGNVIDPYTILNGGKDKNAQPAYGVDTLRWWVASHGTQHSQIVISKKLLDDSQQEVIRIRNMLKFLLGVVNDLKKPAFEQKPELNYFDAYLVKQCHDFAKNVQDNYNLYRYNSVAQTVLFFISNQVSSLYCQCVKDRLYCSERESNDRLSAQLVVHTILTVMCKILAPILPHLVEEAWQHHPLYEKPFFFTRNVPVLPPVDADTKLMDAILEIKKDIFAKTKNENLKKFILDLNLNNELYGSMIELNESDGVMDSVLCEILEVSSVEIHLDDKLGDKWSVEVSVSDRNQCLRCRKYNAELNSDKCVRCENVVRGLD